MQQASSPPTSHDALILQRARSSLALARLRPQLSRCRHFCSSSKAIAHLAHGVHVLLSSHACLLSRSLQLLPLVLKRPLPANGLYRA